MTMLPVFVQPPNQPDKGAVVGRADSHLDADAVAKLVGVPDGCLADGKIIRSRKRGDYWSLVAYVEIVPRAGTSGETDLKSSRKAVPFIVNLPLSDHERKLIAEAAEHSGLSMRRWLRTVALAAAGIAVRGAATRPERFVDEDGVVYPPPPPAA